LDTPAVRATSAMVAFTKMVPAVGVFLGNLFMFFALSIAICETSFRSMIMPHHFERGFFALYARATQ
jgi:hypothetical protein